MKKLLIVAPQAFSVINFRGTLIKRLVSHGVNVYTCAPDYSPHIENKICDLGAIPIPINLSRASLNPLKNLKNLISLYKVIVKISPDIIFCYSIKPVIFGILLARIARVPKRVAMIEGLGYVFNDLIAPLSPFRRILKHIVLILYKCSLRFANKVIFLNDDDLNYFIENHICNKKDMYNMGGIGVDLDYWKNESIIEHSPVKFLFAARMIEEKGVYVLIDAIRKLKSENLQCEFLWIGGLDQNPGGISRETIMSWVDEGLIKWDGMVDSRSRMGYSSVFVLPTHYREGVPRSIQEAMAMRLPIITTNVPGAKDTVINGINGFLIPPNNSDSLASAMKIFIQNPSLIKKMGDESCALAHKWFDVYQKDAILEELIMN